MEETIPCFSACLAISSWVSLEKGRPSCLGSWQASAFTATTISGGENAGPAPTRFFQETGLALVEKTFSPFGDYLSRRVKSLAYFFIGKAFGGKENDFSAYDFPIR